MKDNIMFEISDIEIAVLTYNRKAYLEKMLESLVAQTVSGFKISIFDNASDDGTDALVEDFISKNPTQNIHYFKNEKNLGQDGNFAKAVKNTSATYTIVSHDDDMFHPRFVEIAFKILNKEKNISFLSSSYIMDKNAPDANWSTSQVQTNYNAFDDIFDFLDFFVAGYRVNYASAIYRRDALEARVYSKDYGKIGDRHIMVEATKYGRSAIMRDKNLFFHRDHDSSDSNNASNPLPIKDILAIHSYFRDVLKSANRLSSGWFYNFVYAEDIFKLLKFAKIEKRKARQELNKIISQRGGYKILKLYLSYPCGDIFRFIIRLIVGSFKILRFEFTQKKV